MPADLTREEIDAIQERFATDGDPTHDDVWTLIDYARSTPARLASARQEGYREGVADAKQAAGFAAWRHEGDDAHSRGMDAGARHQVAECVKAIVALSPLPAEPSAPVAPDWPTITQREVDGVEYALTRDGDDYSNVKAVLAKLVREKSAALEAENAALREGLDSILSQYVKTLDAGAGNYDGKAFAESLPEVRRARALLQGGPDAG